MKLCLRDGTPTDCSWGVLENYKKLGPDYLKKTDALRSKYHPIELDLTIPLGRVIISNIMQKWRNFGRINVGENYKSFFYYLFYTHSDRIKCAFFDNI